MCETVYTSAGKFLDIIIHLTTGMHELPVQRYRTGEPSQMPWAMCAAYYIPPGMAAPLVDVVDHPQKKKVFKSPDILLAPFTKYLLWPPVFGDQWAQSLCFMHNKDFRD